MNSQSFNDFTLSVNTSVHQFLNHLITWRGTIAARLSTYIKIICDVWVVDSFIFFRRFSSQQNCFIWQATEVVLHLEYFFYQVILSSKDKNRQCRQCILEERTIYIQQTDEIQTKTAEVKMTLSSCWLDEEVKDEISHEENAYLYWMLYLYFIECYFNLFLQTQIILDGLVGNSSKEVNHLYATRKTKYKRWSYVRMRAQ